MKLAARDAVGRLQATLSRVLQDLFRHPVEEKLRDGDFLAQLIREVVMRYVEADVSDHTSITLNTSPEQCSRLAQWAQETFHDAAQNGSLFDLHASLAEAAFEYRTQDGTVEVTADSVVDVLLEMVGPELRKLVAEAQEEKT